MEEKKIRNKRIRNTIVFALILVLVLKTVSWLLVWSDNSTNILQNHCGPAIALEKKDTVDVVAMGNSNFYCSIDPTRVWEQQGIPMYIWGAPSHRIYEIQHDLKTLFKKQSPKVVFIEASCLMRDKSTNAWNQKVKADVASVFQIVANHRNINNFEPGRDSYWSFTERCKSKGYYLKTGTKAYKGKDWMKPTKQEAEIPDVAKKALENCIKICNDNGAEVVLLSIPSPNDWSAKRYNAVSKLAEELNVELLDLNCHMDEIGLNWNKDTCDQGHHMNFRGAEKISTYIGNYLAENKKQLTDHRGEAAYAGWDKDCLEYAQARDDRLRDLGKIK